MLHLVPDVVLQMASRPDPGFWEWVTRMGSILQSVSAIALVVVTVYVVKVYMKQAAIMDRQADTMDRQTELLSSQADLQRLQTETNQLLALASLAPPHSPRSR